MKKFKEYKEVWNDVKLTDENKRNLFFGVMIFVLCVYLIIYVITKW